jgi:hypothetical protein
VALFEGLTDRSTLVISAFAGMTRVRGAKNTNLRI